MKKQNKTIHHGEISETEGSGRTAHENHLKIDQNGKLLKNHLCGKNVVKKYFSYIPYQKQVVEHS